MIDLDVDWYSHCHNMAPLTNKIAKQYQRRLKVKKVDGDKGEVLTKEYTVPGYPTFILFKGRKKIDKIIGENPIGFNKMIKENIK